MDSALVDPNVPDYIYKNYHIKGGYAYTEDHFMVYKLYVYNIPQKTTVGEVREYFLQYGDIKNVRFVADKDLDFTNAAFVHFESPTAAARVLNFYHKSITTGDGGNKLLYFVDVCHSWYQPNCHSTKEIWSTMLSEETQFPTNRDSILVLNDDCLESIIQFLPTSSQVHFARTCSRICKVYQKTCKSMYRTLSVEGLDNMTQWEIRDFFGFAGENMLRIEGKLPKQNHMRMVKSISIFCINLEELELNSSVVHLSGTDLLMRKLNKLKSLTLSACFPILGKDLSNLSPTIERLDLGTCKNIEVRHLFYFCKSLSNLKELSFLDMCFNNTLAVLCQNLEALTLVCLDFNFSFIAHFPKLKKMTIVTSTINNTRSFLTQLVEHKSHQLEFFYLNGTNSVNVDVAQQISQLKVLRTLDCSHSYNTLTDEGLRYFCNLKHLEEIKLQFCHKITIKGLIDLVLKCTKLKRMDLRGSYFFNDLIFPLIRTMREEIQNKTFLRKEPVVLQTNFFDLDEDFLYDPEYKAASHLVNVHVYDYTQKRWFYLP